MYGRRKEVRISEVNMEREKRQNADEKWNSKRK